VPRADEIGVDTRVLGFTFVLAVVTGVAFGLLPAWRTLRAALHDPLKESGRGTVGPGHQRLRNALVVAEIALALVLLVGAGLLLRSFFRVIHADGGFRAEGVLTASVPLPQTTYGEDPKRVAVVERVLEAVRAQPGVKLASSTLPLLGGWQSSFSVEGRPEPPPGQRPSADVARVSTDYFGAMGVRFLEGRVFEPHDRADTTTVCIVDETFARAHWPGTSALGKRIKFGRAGKEDTWMEVVGVVAHVKNYGVDEESRVELYLPWAQSPVSGFTLIVRTDGNPAALATAVRAAVRSVDPDLPVYSVRTLEEILAERTSQRRLAVLLLTVFASVALALAAVGIYGVMSYSVSQRTQEIGVRMALGAERAHILGMVFRHGTGIALIGVGLGLVAAFGLARLISSLLFETSAADPPTFSVVPLLLIAVAVLAAYLPARRATRVDPMTALRYE
jgi:putative ABC transport system permease protein